MLLAIFTAQINNFYKFPIFLIRSHFIENFADFFEFCFFHQKIIKFLSNFKKFYRISLKFIEFY